MSILYEEDCEVVDNGDKFDVPLLNGMIEDYAIGHTLKIELINPKKQILFTDDNIWTWINTYYMGYDGVIDVDFEYNKEHDICNVTTTYDYEDEDTEAEL